MAIDPKMAVMAGDAVAHQDAELARDMMQDERYPLIKRYIEDQVRIIDKILFATLESKGGGKEQLVEAKCLARLRGHLLDIASLPEYLIQKEKDIERKKDESPTMASEW